MKHSSSPRRRMTIRSDPYAAVFSMSANLSRAFLTQTYLSMRASIAEGSDIDPGPPKMDAVFGCSPAPARKDQPPTPCVPGVHLVHRGPGRSAGWAAEVRSGLSLQA